MGAIIFLIDFSAFVLKSAVDELFNSLIILITSASAQGSKNILDLVHVQSVVQLHTFK